MLEAQILALASLVSQLGLATAAQARANDTTCAQMSYIVHKLSAGATYCGLPLPDNSTAALYANIVRKSCNESNTSKGAELGEAAFQHDVATLGREGAC
jgi:hypothetical protein